MVETRIRLALRAMYRSPTTPNGATAGDIYVVSFIDWTQYNNALVPASVGHVFKTTTRGTAFSPLNGNGTGSNLPNVPVWVVRYDPGDATNNTVYAATDIG